MRLGEADRPQGDEFPPLWEMVVNSLARSSKDYGDASCHARLALRPLLGAASREDASAAIARCLDECKAECLALLREHWQLVEVTADRLQAEGVLSWKALRQIASS